MLFGPIDQQSNGVMPGGKSDIYMMREREYVASEIPSKYRRKQTLKFDTVSHSLVAIHRKL